MSNTKTITTLFGVVETSGNVRRLRKNTISKNRRQCVITRIDEMALAIIDTVADKWNLTRGEVISQFARNVRRNNPAVFGEGVSI